MNVTACARKIHNTTKYKYTQLLNILRMTRGAFPEDMEVLNAAGARLLSFLTCDAFQDGELLSLCRFSFLQLAKE